MLDARITYRESQREVYLGPDNYRFLKEQQTGEL